LYSDLQLTGSNIAANGTTATNTTITTTATTTFLFTTAATFSGELNF